MDERRKRERKNEGSGSKINMGLLDGKKTNRRAGNGSYIRMKCGNLRKYDILLGKNKKNR